MGRYHRQRPEHLADKLLYIRQFLGFSQHAMIRHLGLEDEITQSRISGYELGTREPSLPTLLKYARVAGVSTDALIDDEMSLPEKLPVKSKGEVVGRRSSGR